MFKGVFLDLSGVLYEGSQALPGAVEAVSNLAAAGLTLRFVTNTSRRNHQQLLGDLAKMGFLVQPEQLFSAPMAAAVWVRTQGKRPLLIVHPDIESEFDGLATADPDVVVLGDAGTGLDYHRLDEAFRLLIDGAPLVAIGDNRYFRDDTGLHLDAGPFVRALEYAAGVNAVVTGKPSRAFFDLVLAESRLAANEVIMLGDDVHGDIAGALGAGLSACLVRTGKYRSGDESCIDGEFSVSESLSAWTRDFLPSLL